MTSFDIHQPYLLENERVRLAPLTTEHYYFLKHFAIEQPNLWQYSLVAVNGANGMQQYIETALHDKLQGTAYPFAVYDKQLQQYAGCTRFYDIQLKYGTTQLGYTWYGQQFQGTGLNKHCKYLLLNFAFEQMGMQRVEFRADDRNQKSIAAMKSIGCTVEGILRSHLPNLQGGRRNSIVLSILKNEWEQQLKTALFQKLV